MDRCGGESRPSQCQGRDQNHGGLARRARCRETHHSGAQVRGRGDEGPGIVPRRDPSPEPERRRSQSSSPSRGARSRPGDRSDLLRHVRAPLRDADPGNLGAFGQYGTGGGGPLGADRPSNAGRAGHPRSAAGDSYRAGRHREDARRSWLGALGPRSTDRALQRPSIRSAGHRKRDPLPPGSGRGRNAFRRHVGRPPRGRPGRSDPLERARESGRAGPVIGRGGRFRTRWETLDIEPLCHRGCLACAIPGWSRRTYRIRAGWDERRAAASRPDVGARRDRRLGRRG